VLLEALSGISVDIEHVGSTSVPGLAAKPIIDIDIVFKDAGEFGQIKAQLEQIGYYHNGDQGIPGREAFKRKQGVERDALLDRIRHHLYVCPVESEELHRHLAFRDHLRRNPGSCRQYEALKLAIAAEAGQDRKLYAEMKQVKAAAFIHACIERAKGNL
jgi:GrpB-like predicted nucleotidyltransferase (UPF0157 family)